MTELSDVARASAKGSFFLFLGNTSSTLILALGSILVARLLGPENYGLYSVALIVPAFLISLGDLGTSPALTRFSAQFRAQKKHLKVRALIKSGILFKLLLFPILALILLTFSNFIAENILKRQEITFLIKLASLYLIGQSIYVTIDSIFIGLDKMEISGLLMNLQAITKVASSILLITYGLSTSGAILGIGLSFILASIIGLILIIVQVNPELNSGDGDNINIIPGLKMMVNYGKPLCVSTLMTSLLTQYRILILALFASNYEIGNYNTAMNYTVLITLLSYPIAKSLFPAFSKLNIKESYHPLEKMFKLSIKYASLLIMPASLIIALLSREAVWLLYGPQYQYAPNYLALYILSFLCVGLGMFVLDNLFNSQGDTNATFKINLANFLPAVTLAPILTLYYGVLGLIGSILTSQLISIIYGLFLAHRKYSLNPDWKNILKIGVASLTCLLIVYTTLNTTPIDDYLYRLILGGALYTTLYLAIAPITGAINRTDIQNLQESTKEIAIYPIIKPILKLETKILNLL